MRALRVVIVALITTLSSLVISPAHADTTIVLSEPTHRDANGIFVNDSLATAISSEGALGKLVFDRPRRVDTWVIDVALIEEVQDLADGYTYFDEKGGKVSVDKSLAAEIWLSTLNSALRTSSVLALPYGNPSISYLSNVAPNELSILRNLAQQRLSTFLGRGAGFAPNSLASTGKISRPNSLLYRNSLQEISILNSLVTSSDIESLRLRLAELVNPKLPKSDFDQIAKSFEDAVKAMKKRIRVTSGNYTITASQYDLPVTVINDFDQQINVDVDAWTSNSRVTLGTIPRISVPARSQIQIKVPITVIASGDTTLAIQLHAPNGKAVGEIEEIPLRLAVISPVTTWFIVGMALTLLFAAIIQSLRRVKRRRTNES